MSSSCLSLNTAVLLCYCVIACIITTSMFCFVAFQNKLPSPFFAGGDRSKERQTDGEMQCPTDGTFYSLQEQHLTMFFCRQYGVAVKVHQSYSGVRITQNSSIASSVLKMGD